MANNLGTDIEGRFVLINVNWFASKEQAADIRERVFLAEGGFGCRAFTMGTAIVGEFVVDGERTRVEGFNLDSRFATKEEVEAAMAERDRRHLAGNERLLAAMVALQ